jgi:hypothetical protein
MSRLRGKVAVALVFVGLAVASCVVALAAASAVGAQVKNRLRGFDPALQPVRLSASDTAPDAWLGGSVAVSADGSTIAAATAYHPSQLGPFPWSNPPSASTGRIYVFVRGDRGWSNGTQAAELTATTRFGDPALVIRSVSVSGDGSTIVAGGGQPDRRIARPA